MFFLKKDIPEEALIKIGFKKKENKKPMILGVKYKNNQCGFFKPKDDYYWIMNLDCPVNLIIYEGMLLEALTTDGENIYDVGEIRNKTRLYEFDYIEKVKQATKIFDYCIEGEKCYDGYCVVPEDEEEMAIFSSVL